MRGSSGEARTAYGGKARTAFARTLWRIGRDPAVVPVLIDLIREDDFLLRSGAFEVLEEIGPEAKAAIPLLIEMLDHKNRFLRQAAAKALGRIGPAAKVAIPALEKAIGDPETANRIEVAAALWRVAHAEAAVVALSAEARRIGETAKFGASLSRRHRQGSQAEVDDYELTRSKD
jgi:HEAT repeat protein